MGLGRMMIALAVFMAIMGAVHGYVWMRLVRDPGWGAPWGRVLGAALVTLVVMIPATFLGMRALPRALNAPLAWVAYVWMGFLLYLFLLTLASDLGRAALAVAGALPRDPDRRQWLARAIGSAVAGASGVIGLAGAANVARGFEVKRVRVPIGRLPKTAAGYRIVQISDIHVGPTIGRDFVEEWSPETNALAPDLVVITDDLVDGTVEQLAAPSSPCAKLRAKDGVFFVTGNHEYYSGVDEWIAHLATLGVRVLRNERVPIGARRSTSRASTIHGARRFRARPRPECHARDRGSRPDPRGGAPRSSAQGGLRGAADDVDLQLSGHVHGGQLFPFNLLVLPPAVRRRPSQGGRTGIYVNNGTGYWGPPMRVGTRAELTCVELDAA